MEKLGVYLLVLLITLLYTTTSGGTTNPTTTSNGGTTNSSATDFIKASCKPTLYPTLCIRCLSSYADSIQSSDHELAKTALTVSLNNAKSASAFVAKLAGASGIKPIEHQAVMDCVNSMNNSVASLSQAVQELAQMALFRDQKFEWHMSNVETWVSSALTNQNTCSRGFSDSSMDGYVKDAVNRRMVYVSHITSNALALVNRFAVRHKDGTHMP